MHDSTNARALFIAVPIFPNEIEFPEILNLSEVYGGWKMLKSLLLLTLQVVFTLFLILVLVPSQANAQGVSELLEKLEAYPDLIVLNGKIALMDDQVTLVEVMAVRDRRVLVLGTSEEIRALAGPQTQVIDVKGRTVLPGIIDSHTHPHLWL